MKEIPSEINEITPEVVKLASERVRNNLEKWKLSPGPNKTVEKMINMAKNNLKTIEENGEEHLAKYLSEVLRTMRSFPFECTICEVGTTLIQKFPDLPEFEPLIHSLKEKDPSGLIYSAHNLACNYRNRSNSSGK